MNEEIVEEFESWFAGYVQKFKSGNPEWQPNIKRLD
jgi:hypothetical protein